MSMKTISSFQIYCDTVTLTLLKEKVIIKHVHVYKYQAMV